MNKIVLMILMVLAFFTTLSYAQLGGGELCTSNSQCLSGICSANTCVYPKFDYMQQHGSLGATGSATGTVATSFGFNISTGEFQNVFKDSVSASTQPFQFVAVADLNDDGIKEFITLPAGVIRLFHIDETGTTVELAAKQQKNTEPDTGFFAFNFAVANVLAGGFDSTKPSSRFGEREIILTAGGRFHVYRYRDGVISHVRQSPQFGGGEGALRCVTRTFWDSSFYLTYTDAHKAPFCATVNDQSNELVVWHPTQDAASQLYTVTLPMNVDFEWHAQHPPIISDHFGNEQVIGIHIPVKDSDVSTRILTYAYNIFTHSFTLEHTITTSFFDVVAGNIDQSRAGDELCVFDSTSGVARVRCYDDAGSVVYTYDEPFGSCNQNFVTHPMGMIVANGIQSSGDDSVCVAYRQQCQFNSPSDRRDRNRGICFNVNDGADSYLHGTSGAVQSSVIPIVGHDNPFSKPIFMQDDTTTTVIYGGHAMRSSTLTPLSGLDFSVSANTIWQSIDYTDNNKQELLYRSGSQFGVIFSGDFTETTTQVPLQLSPAVGDTGGFTGWYETVCRNTNITFAAQECDGSVPSSQCNYFNEVGQQERITTTCGGQFALTNGDWDANNPTFTCNFTSTGQKSVTLYLQDERNPNNFAVRNPQPITFDVIDGTEGLNCNLPFEQITDPDYTPPVAPPPITPPPVESEIPFVDNLEGWQRLLIGLLIIGGLMILASKYTNSPVIIMLFGGIGLTGSVAIGLLSPWIIGVMVALALVAWMIEKKTQGATV